MLGCLIFLGSLISYIIIALIFGSICHYKLYDEYDPEFFGMFWPIGIPFVLIREFLENKKYNKEHKRDVVCEVLKELKLR